MISNIGHFFQIAAIIFNILAVITALSRVYCQKQFLKVQQYTKLTITFFYGSVLSSLLGFSALVYGFIISDFSIQNVFLNSSTLKPLIFKIAASWASHEGSILLWLCLLQIISLIYICLLNYYLSKTNLNLQCRSKRIPEEASCWVRGNESNISIIILALIQIMFGSFIYFTSNPFTSLSFHPAQGLGLNPMLQDVALLIHPPILYLGYVSYIAPFTSACMILLLGNPTITHLQIIKIFANLGILFLTLGIALGSWWAYRELGWGGFWFFDPVENISLLPWLSGIVLYHSVNLTMQTGRMANWTICLAILTFLIAIFSTFLVRSGLINSIHSFALSQERAIYMLAIFTIIAVSSLILLIMKNKKDSFMPSLLLTPVSEKFMVVGGSCFLIALIVLLYATIYPVAYSILYNQSISIGESFFINNFIIFIIPTILLAAVSYNARINRKSLLLFASSLIITILTSCKISYGLISMTITLLSLFLMLESVSSYLEKMINRKRTVNLSMILGHFGFGLLALSITLNSLLQSEFDFIGKVGDKITTEDFKITLKSIRYSATKNYYHQIVEFWLQDKNNNLTILTPENRFYTIEQQLSQESNIYSYLLYDLYAVLNKIDEETIHAKIYYKPLMSFIWLSIIIIAGGFLISLLNNPKANTS